jgi:hypothetical protein
LAIVHLGTLTHRASRPTIAAETNDALVLPLLRQLLNEIRQGETIKMIAVRLRTYEEGSLCRNVSDIPLPLNR